MNSSNELQDLAIRGEAGGSHQFIEISPINNSPLWYVPNSNFRIERSAYEMIVVRRVEVYASYCKPAPKPKALRL